MIDYRLITVCDVCGIEQTHFAEHIDKGKTFTKWFDGSWELEYTFTCKNCNKVRDVMLAGYHYIENEYFNRPSCVEK